MTRLHGIRADNTMDGVAGTAMRDVDQQSQ